MKDDMKWEQKNVNEPMHASGPKGGPTESGLFKAGLAVAAGLIIAALAMKFMRPVIIVITSLVGGIAASSLILEVDKYLTFGFMNALPSKMVIAATCFILGLLVQFITTKSPNAPVRRAPKHSRRR